MPGMKLIERYIFKRAGVAALVTLGSLAGVVWIIQALKELDVITTKGQTIIAYLALTTLAIPMLLLAVIPIALLLATVFTVNTMNSNSELVVVNASGASSWVLAKPLLVLALLCSIFTGIVGHFVSPWSLLTLKVFATEMRADLVQVIIRDGTFTKVENGLVFHVAKREPGGVLSGILISDEREPGKSVLFTAAKGFVSRDGENAYLLLKDGEIQQRDADGGNLTVIKYESYLFDLSTFAAKIEMGDIRPKERTTPQLLNPDPDDRYYREKPGLYRSQIHERFSEMLWPFAYVLIMLAFAGHARSNRQNHGSAIGAGMLVATMLRGLAFSAVAGTKTDPSMVFFVYALPLAGIAGGTYMLVRGRPISLPRKAQEKVDLATVAAQQRLREFNQRYVSWRRRLAGVRA
ncbi:MAG: LPS export ABC transporter permease LptF [Nitratireductor sp.]|nr:LPS export ABC transporter permease LptF [Nitratireductor sp.]